MPEQTQPLPPVDCLKGIQTKLQRAGYYAGKIDGEWGPLTDEALQELRIALGAMILRGGPGWPWTARVSGSDILIVGSVTWFGGPDDPNDSGETMSGVDNKRYGVLGCALPVAWWVSSTRDSPFCWGRTSGPTTPGIPWQTPVRVTWKGKSVEVPLIDNGPSEFAQDCCDLTPYAFDQFGVVRTRNSGTLSGATVRIIGGAKFVP
jgi:hypothetical protein